MLPKPPVVHVETDTKKMVGPDWKVVQTSDGHLLIPPDPAIEVVDLRECTRRLNQRLFAAEKEIRELRS